MADDRRIVIELKSIGSDEEEKKPGEPDPEPNVSGKRKAIISAATSMANVAYKEIMAQVTYNVGNYINLTEDYKASVLLDNVKSTVEKVKNLASTTISTAMLGAKLGGGVGAAAGAAVGFIYDIASESLSIYRQYNQQELGLILNDKQSQYSVSRMGLINNGRGTLN